MGYLEKNSLREALDDNRCAELPPELKDGDIFVRAIVRVLKANNKESMCLAVNDGSGNPLIKKTYGSVASIVKVLDIYPLSILDKNYIPVFRTKEEIIKFLIRCGEDSDYLACLLASDAQEDKDKIKALVIKHCVGDQLSNENMERRAAIREQRQEEEKQRQEEEKQRRAEEIAKKEEELKRRVKNGQETKRKAVRKNKPTKSDF